MSARKTKRTKPQSPARSAAAQSPPVPLSPGDGDGGPRESAQWTREAVESIVVAILLALLFRGFEAEAFIIPTGSMAPTLQGRHKDVRCPQCNYQFRAGAAQEATFNSQGPVVGVTCPMCRFELRIDPDNPNDDSFSGDRILVNKFVYQISEPRRWDVIVFKFPGNAKQNYIKRLVGLPGETIRVRHGDVFARGSDESTYEILRKPARKLPYLLHLVHDTRYIPPALISVDWPPPWQETVAGDAAADGGNEGAAWSTSEDRSEYRLQPSHEMRWLRYRHLPPRRDDWRAILAGRLPHGLEQRPGELITDFYAYNAYRQRQDPNGMHSRQLSGWHWVGDLAVEALIKVQDSSGQLALQLVEGGHKLNCQIDVATGIAEVTIDEGRVAFAGVDGAAAPSRLQAQTPIKRPGTYRVMWSNVDDQIMLWVNRRVVELTANDRTHPGYFQFPSDPTPTWSNSDPGDLMPAAVGGQGVALTVTDLRIYRDIYYVAAKGSEPNRFATDYRSPIGDRGIDEVRAVFTDPQRWERSRLWEARSQVEFELDADQFFPMGDNSPQSKDARLWGGDQNSLFDPSGYVMVKSFVDRELLIGKAFLVYWPHGWNPGKIRLPILPNLDRMGRIR